MRKLLLSIILSFVSLIFINGQGGSKSESFISNEKGKNNFLISAEGKSTPLLVSSKEWPGVIRAFKDLQSDIGKVTSAVPELLTDEYSGSKTLIIAGTIGRNPLIDKLISDKKIDATGVAGNWETFLIQVVKKPLKSPYHSRKR
jgi:hypothetical protein